MTRKTGLVYGIQLQYGRRLWQQRWSVERFTRDLPGTCLPEYPLTLTKAVVMLRSQSQFSALWSSVQVWRGGGLISSSAPARMAGEVIVNTDIPEDVHASMRRRGQGNQSYGDPETLQRDIPLPSQTTGLSEWGVVHRFFSEDDVDFMMHSLQGQHSSRNLLR